MPLFDMAKHGRFAIAFDQFSSRLSSRCLMRDVDLLIAGGGLRNARWMLS